MLPLQRSDDIPFPPRFPHPIDPVSTRRRQAEGRRCRREGKCCSKGFAIHVIYTTPSKDVLMRIVIVYWRLIKLLSVLGSDRIQRVAKSHMNASECDGEEIKESEYKRTNNTNRGCYLAKGLWNVIHYGFNSEPVSKFQTLYLNLHFFIIIFHFIRCRRMGRDEGKRHEIK